MEEVLHANIFFVITATVTVCLGMLVGVLLYHIIKIVQSVRRIVERIELGSEKVAQEYEVLKAQLSPIRFLSFISAIFTGSTVKKKSKTKL